MKKTRAKTARRSKPRSAHTIESLASQIAAALVPHTVPDFASVLATDDAVSTLYDALIARVAAYERISLPPAAQALAMYERFESAMPEEIHKEFVEYDDRLGEREMLAREAGFHLGVMVGRRLARLAGGAR